MASSQPYDLSAQTTLDGSGNGTAQLGPNGPFAIDLSLISIFTVNQSATVVPSCSIYAGSSVSSQYLVDSTYNGQSNSTSKASGQRLYPGQNVFAVWTGGIPGDKATVRVTGQRVTGYRSG
jgi:hypothetical protein